MALNPYVKRFYGSIKVFSLVSRCVLYVPRKFLTAGKQILLDKTRKSVKSAFNSSALNRHV